VLLSGNLGIPQLCLETEAVSVDLQSYTQSAIGETSAAGTTASRPIMLQVMFLASC
jgi:hypothetical protein